MVFFIIDDCTKRISLELKMADRLIQARSFPPRRSAVPAHLQGSEIVYHQVRHSVALAGEVLLIQIHRISQLVVHSLSSCLITSELAQSRSIIGPHTSRRSLRCASAVFSPLVRTTVWWLRDTYAKSKAIGGADDDDNRP
jgi:hypothetical protein